MPRRGHQDTFPESSSGQPDIGADEREDQWRTDVDDFNGYDTDSEQPVEDGEQTPSVPERTPEDQENRDVDREILGKSVRTRLAIESTAKNAVSKSEALWAKTKNAVASPYRNLRKFRKHIAEQSLERKQNRHTRKFGGGEGEEQVVGSKQSRLDTWKESKDAAHQEKFDTKQQEIDAMRDGRLKDLRQKRLDAKRSNAQAKIENKFNTRQAKIDNKRQNSQAKIDSFEQGHVTNRRDKYSESATAAESRTNSAIQSASERQERFNDNREAAIANRELALARKKLRKELREVDGASWGEKRQLMKDILQDTDQGELRDLGRKVVEARMAEQSKDASISNEMRLDRRKKNTEGLLGRAQDTLKSLPSALENNQTEQNDLMSLTEKAEQKIAALSENSSSDNPEYTQLQRHLSEANAKLARLKSEQKRLERQQENLPDRISELEARLVDDDDQLAAQRINVQETFVANDSAQENLDASLENILNPNKNEQEN